MQPIKTLVRHLEEFGGQEHYLFRLTDLQPLFPDLSGSALKALLSRAVSSGVLVRVCRGIYLYEKAGYPRGLLLFHVAAYLRADALNYLSLETVLSDAGVISQVLINRITVMSSGRTSEIRCGSFGVIEFVHTNQTALEIKDQLTYDSRCHLWRASIKQALRDMRVTRRNMDLVNWDEVAEYE